MKLGVIGDPIKHSISPAIHAAFAQQWGHAIEYEKHHVIAENLPDFVHRFFENGGHGLNVTLPHKHSVTNLCHRLEDSARLSGAANTLFRDGTGQLIGASTDGLGFLNDLAKRGIALKNKHILLIGAGGASYSIIPSLLKSGAQIVIANRTLSKAEALVTRFASLGTLSVCELTDKTNDLSINPFPTLDLDGVINAASVFSATATFLDNLSFNENAFAYDLNYGERAKPFIRWASSNGFSQISEGIGMLIEQAAASFHLWTQFKPDTDQIDPDWIKKSACNFAQPAK